MQRALGHLLEIGGLLAVIAGVPLVWFQLGGLRRIDMLAHGEAGLIHQWPIWALMSLPVLAGLTLFGAGYHLVRHERRRLYKQAPR
jgi:hypothetical protein